MAHTPDQLGIIYKIYHDRRLGSPQDFISMFQGQVHFTDTRNMQYMSQEHSIHVPRIDEIYALALEDGYEILWRTMDMISRVIMEKA